MIPDQNNLSLRARGLLALYLDAGRVLSIAEAQPLVKEGRDAVRSAFNELKDSGYIFMRKYKTREGQWVYEYGFTSDWKTTYGFSGALHRGTDYIANSTNLLVGLNKLSPTNSSGAPEVEEEFVTMAWPGFEDEEPVVKRSRIDDSDSGAIGKVEDRIQARNAKYKKDKFAAVPPSMLRKSKPEDEWNTQDLVTEFYELVSNMSTFAPSQCNGRSMATWINKMVGQGVPRIAILKAMRAFFLDPRLTKDVGIGQPLWRRFIAYYPTVHGLYARDTEVVYDDEEFLSYQDKALKLLED